MTALSPETWSAVSLAWIALAVVVCAILFKVAPPFGRHTTARWGPTLATRVGWVAMELPSLAIMTAFLLSVPAGTGSYVWILFALWIAHYVNRTLLFPLRIRPAATRIPVVIVASAIAFNLVNAGLNGGWLASHAADYGVEWLRSPRFALGLALFLAGAWINLKADAMLIRLRQPGGPAYSIPRGFLFERVSSPNLFGEMVEWTGFAIMAWNLPALSFAVWTVANLLPRAKHHHDWNRARFPDYPPERRVVIPYVY